MGVLWAARWVAGLTETPWSLVVAGSLVKKVKRGEKDDLRVLDGGQVELEHVFTLRDPSKESEEK